jgi:hypothetical protein
LTGKNDFKYINQCLKNATDIPIKVYRVIDDILSQDEFDLESIFIEALGMITEFDEKLSECHGVKHEVERINAWIGHFSNTKIMLDKISKNIQENYAMIMTLGATLPVFIQKKDFKRVGVTIADILQFFIGDIPPIDKLKGGKSDGPVDATI